MEKWRAVFGYEGHYEVSDMGRVRSIDRMRLAPGNPAKLRGRVLRPALSRRGYPGVSLWKDGKGSTKEVHRLVAITFCENPLLLTEVDHIDNDRSNCAASNLTWCTRAFNLAKAADRGMTRASTNPKRAPKFSGSQIDTIRQLRGEGRRLQAIADQFSTSRQYVSDICQRKVWRET